MRYLLDTNILLRLVETNHPHHAQTRDALKKMRQQSHTFCILLQNVSEFWNVCTRPSTKNGLGLSIVETDLQLKRLERFFTLLPDTEEVYRHWRDLVVTHEVSGIQVHDTKIVAAMKTHGIKDLLTYNSRDFHRYSDIKAIEPKNV